MKRPTPTAPGPGQESVWDYPRPPRLELSTERLEIWLGGERIASTFRSLRVLETSHPPTYYLHESSFVAGSLSPSQGQSWCEWKGQARYFDVHGGGRVARRAAWTYPEPTATFTELRDHVAVMPAQMDRCTVDGETVVPQQGGFYGGWITSKVVGPFKGEASSLGW